MKTQFQRQQWMSLTIIEKKSTRQYWNLQVKDTNLNKSRKLSYSTNKWSVTNEAVLKEPNESKPFTATRVHQPSKSEPGRRERRQLVHLLIWRWNCYRSWRVIEMTHFVRQTLHAIRGHSWRVIDGVVICRADGALADTFRDQKKRLVNFPVRSED